MLRPIIDIIRQANTESIKPVEYECWSCGKFHPSDEIEVRSINDQGERQDIQVCRKCLDHGWDEWRLS